MRLLSNEVRLLLEKLYNLRGEDSVILKKMNKERDEAIETKERTKNEKAVLLEEIDNLTQEEKTLADEGNKLIEVLGSIHRNDFAFVLERLNIDFDPAAINTKVTRQLPETIAKVVEANKKASQKLENVEIEMNNAITKIEELGLRKDEALSNQAKLNDIFSLALSGNINITRDEITSLLEKFDFTEEERREAAKILMFPEDALYEFDENFRNGGAKRYKEEVKEEIKEEVQSNIEEVKESSNQDSKLEDIFTKVVEENVDDDIFKEITSNIKEEPKEINLNEVKENPQDKLNKLLSNYNLYNTQFNKSNLDKLINNFDEKIIKDNLEILKKNNFNLDIVISNVEILYDKELKEKIDKLLTIGKEVKDICLVPKVLTKYNLEGLNKTINVFEVSGLDPKKVPLMAY